MADKILPIPLVKGLDLVTPPLMVEPGSLIDCMNYEVTDTAGYRRIDGYEKYDGYPNGALYEFYRFHITAVVIDDQSSIAPGRVISRVGPAGKTEVGVIVGDVGGGYYEVAPRDSLDAFVVDEQFLIQYNGGGFLLLQSEMGLLKIIGTPSPLGDTFVVTKVDGTDFQVTVDSTPIPGRELYAAQPYLDQLRTYSGVLRNLVQNAPGAVAGLYWFEDRLIEAVNAQQITLTLTHGAAIPPNGTRMRWNGIVYRLIWCDFVKYDVNDYYNAVMYPISTTATVDDNLVEIKTDGTTIATWVTGVTLNGNPQTDNVDYAVLGYANNPAVAPTRGFTYMTPAVTFNYDAGKYTGSLISPPLTFDKSISSGTQYYLVNAGDGTACKVYLTSITKSTGNWSDGTAQGRAQIVVGDVVAGTRDYVKDNDEIHDTYPTTASSKRFVVNGNTTAINIAGTHKLEAAGKTRYQWGTYNFYGQSSTLTAYGVTGASRAFWANKTGYGQIEAISDVTLDNPKYLAFHGNRLALGFKQGAVLFSVAGLPYDFEGLDGAIEQDTGDDITGLLELPGDTLAVFGRRTIRSITGSDSTNMQLRTISGNSGAFDYTVCLIGANAVYTNNNGVTTLEQTADYGDFVGRRLSDKVSNWLRPKLSKTGKAIEDGGVLCAYVCRAKNQYRLVLETGEHIVFALMQDSGVAITFSDYSFLNEKRVPLTWSSEVGVDGHEHMHVVWDNQNLTKQVFELDSGWGFNGSYFQSYFDIAHLFLTNSASNFGVEKARLYGRGYGVATLDIKTSSIEDGFTQSYYNQTQNISMPRKVELLYTRSQPVTGIIDTASWGLGTKIRIQGSNPVNSTQIEPSHTCQVLVLHIRSDGATDD